MLRNTTPVLIQEVNIASLVKRNQSSKVKPFSELHEIHADVTYGSEDQRVRINSSSSALGTPNWLNQVRPSPFLPSLLLISLSSYSFVRIFPPLKKHITEQDSAPPVAP